MKTISKIRNGLLFIALLFTCNSFGQTNKITVKITGKENELLTGAVGELRHVKDSMLAKVSVADAEGLVAFENIKAGDYFLKVTFLGYNAYRSENFSYSGAESKTLQEVKLTESAVALKQAEVTAFKPLIQVKADKTIFNVENSINSTGSTVYELLLKAPGVVVDNNDNISLKGRSGVLVQIDGRNTHLSESELADYLKSMQSTDVEAIEIISNPSSKYDAEGTAGIINIKLKKNKNFGTNGSVTLGYAIGTYSKYNTAISLNNRSKKFNFFSNYSNNWGDRANDFYLYREQNPYYFNQSSISKRSGLNQNYKAGLDYTISKKNTVGVMVNGNYSDIKGTNTNRNNISDFETQTVDSILKSDQEFTNKNNNFNLNLNHHFSDTLGHDLMTDFDFGYNDGIRNSTLPNEYVLPDGTPLSSTYYRSETPTIIRIFTLKTDYSQNFLKGKLGIGYKLSFVNTDNIFDFFNIVDDEESLDTTRSSHFIYKENVNAVYVNYERTVNKFEFQAGVRMENTNSDGDLKSDVEVENKNVKRNYTDFFPSAGITYNPNQNHSIGLIYSSRIDRPNYQELNPFEYKLDELSYMKGNPFLDPQYSHKIDLTYTYKYATSLSVGYSRTNDFFAKIADTLSGGVSYLTSKNLATEDVINANLSTSLQPVKWYSLYLNAGVSNQAYDADFGDGKTINTNFTFFNLYAQNTFKIPLGFTFEISGWFNSGGIWGGAYKTDAQGSLDAGLQKKLFHDQVTIKATVTDILHTAPWSAVNTYAGIVSGANGSWESQQFRASLTWRFGNRQMKGIRQRTAGSESEQKRIQGEN